MPSRANTAPLIIALSCLIALATHAEIPAAAQQEIDHLVQQDKFAEALAKVDGLLKDNPTDKDLLDLKAQLEKSRPSSSPAAAAPKLKGEDRLLLDTLNAIIDDIKAASEDANRRRLMEEFLAKSKPFVAKFPDQTNIWLMRAAAAMELNDVDSGWQAGQKLKAMGALDSDDAQTRKIMMSLNRKEWLGDNFEKAKSANREAKLAVSLSNLPVERQKLIGTWVLASAHYSSIPSSKRNGTIRIFLSDEGSLHISGKASTSGVVNDPDPFSGSLEVPDQALAFDGSITADWKLKAINGPYRDQHEGTSCKMELSPVEITISPKEVSYWIITYHFGRE